MDIHIKVDVYHHFSDSSLLLGKLDRIERLVTSFQRSEELHMSALDDKIAELTTTVHETTDLDESILAVLNGFPAIMQAAIDKALAAGATPVQLQAITDATAALQTKAPELKAAVVANTPASPTP